MNKIKIIALLFTFLISSCVNTTQAKFINQDKSNKNQEQVSSNQQIKSPENIKTDVVIGAKTAFPSPSPVGINSIGIGDNNISSSNACPKPNPDKLDPFQGFYSIENAISLKGQVYDNKGNLLNGTEIIAKTTNSDNIKWERKITTEKNGSFIFKDVPTGTIIEVTANKSGYNGKRRLEIIKTGLVCYNIYNFGGRDFPEDEKYALEQIEN